ncbi:MAG: hypothetical protein R2857_01455 [Vampirovibrionales bacterium]
MPYDLVLRSPPENTPPQNQPSPAQQRQQQGMADAMANRDLRSSTTVPAQTFGLYPNIANLVQTSQFLPRSLQHALGKSCSLQPLPGSPAPRIPGAEGAPA